MSISAPLPQHTNKMNVQGPLSPSAQCSTSERRVTFSRDVTVRSFDASACNENKESLWYSSEEIREQRQKDMKNVRMIRESATSSKVSQDAMVKVVESLPEQTGWNIRGLEATIDGGNQKSENKLRGVLAVLMEQDRQDMEDKKPSDIKIAKRYIKATQRCQTAAFLRAIMDRSAVETSFQTKKQSFEQKNVELSRFLQPNALRISPRAA